MTAEILTLQKYGCCAPPSSIARLRPCDSSFLREFIISCMSLKLRNDHWPSFMTPQSQFQQWPKILELFFRASYNDLNEKHQPDAVNRYIFHLCSVSTCFGQNIAHHQEINKMYKCTKCTPYADLYILLISWWWAMFCPKHVETEHKWNIYLLTASGWCFSFK